MSKVERFEHKEIKMVRGHKLVDEDREFSMSEEEESTGNLWECASGEMKILSKQLIMLVM